MSRIHVIELDQVVPQPWRNGGGVTRELLTWPPGSGADWQLRVSVAEIERDGPFSAFPQVERWFAVLEGAGVVLSFPGREHRLTPGSQPLAFDGALAPGCRLISGPTRDLNLMARTAAGRSRMRPVSGATVAEGGPRVRWRGVYTAEPLSVAVEDGSPPIALPPHSLAWTDAAAPWRALTSTALPRAWWLSLEQP
jgi:hypothetical protein